MYTTNLKKTKITLFIFLSIAITAFIGYKFIIKPHFVDINLTAVTQDKISKWTNDDFNGHYSWVYFGYTNCPDFCPTVLAEMGAELKKVPNANLKAYFVTIDAQNDTEMVIQSYLKNFDSLIMGITGTKEEINRLIKEYGIYSQFTEEEEYQSKMHQHTDASDPKINQPINSETNKLNMSHSNFVLLLDKNGDFLRKYDYEEVNNLSQFFTSK